MTKPRTITKEDILGVLPNLNPRRTNPNSLDGGGCVYTDPKDPNRHCIAGEILVQLGLDQLVPGQGSRNNEGVGIDMLLGIAGAKVSIDRSTTEFFLWLQVTADRGDRWGAVVKAATTYEEGDDIA